MKSIRFVILGALAAGLIAAGCGSDDNNDKQSFGTSVGSASTASLSKAEFVSQANAICQTSNQELDQAGQALGQNPTPEELNSFVTDNVVPTIQKQLDAIRSLGAPAGDEQTVNAILAAADTGLQNLEADPTLITTSGGDPFSQANQLADDYGLTVCGSGGSDNSGSDNSAGDNGGASSSGGADDGTDTGSGTTGAGSAGGSSGSGGSGSGAPSTDSNNDGINDPSG
jgi:hypothetical protein